MRRIRIKNEQLISSKLQKSQQVLKVDVRPKVLALNQNMLGTKIKMQQQMARTQKQLCGANGKLNQDLEDIEQSRRVSVFSNYSNKYIMREQNNARVIENK